MSILGWAWLVLAIATPVIAIAVAGYKHQREVFDGEEVAALIAAGFLCGLFAPAAVPLAAIIGTSYLIFRGGALAARGAETRHQRKLDRLASDAEAIRRTRDMFDVESFTWTILNDEYREAEAARREACQS